MLKHLESSCGGWENGIGKLLEVNNSVTCLLDSVAKNQMLLKDKMGKALDALSGQCHRKDDPCRPVCGNWRYRRLSTVACGCNTPKWLGICCK
jgi:hypothetical protein